MTGVMRWWGRLVHTWVGGTGESEGRGYCLQLNNSILIPLGCKLTKHDMRYCSSNMYVTSRKPRMVRLV